MGYKAGKSATTVPRGTSDVASMLRRSLGSTSVADAKASSPVLDAILAAVPYRDVPASGRASWSSSVFGVSVFCSAVTVVCGASFGVASSGSGSVCHSLLLS